METYLLWCNHIGAPIYIIAKDNHYKVLGELQINFNQDSVSYYATEQFYWHLNSNVQIYLDKPYYGVIWK